VGEIAKQNEIASRETVTNLAPQICDADLVANACGTGEAAEVAFGELIRRHEPRLLQMLRRMILQDADVWDCRQRVYLKLWKGKLKKFDRSRSFPTWLMTVGCNTALDLIRESGRKPKGDATPLDWLAANGVTPDQIVEERETREWIARTLTELPPAQAEAIRLLMEDLGASREEMAVRAGMSTQRWSQTQAKARGALRKLLDFARATPEKRGRKKRKEADQNAAPPDRESADDE